MNDSQQAVFQNLKPLKRDYKRLQRLYNHTDKKATVGAKAVSGEFFDPGTLPELPDSETISSSESVRIEAVAGGGYLVTFITWADE